MQAYIWLENNKAEQALTEGLKPEGEVIKGLPLPGNEGGYIAALLHPADNYAAAGPAELVCLRLNADSKKAYVIDAARTEEKVAGTLAPAEKYVFGTYRRPLLLIRDRIGPENIKKYDGRLDAPLLYENSEKLYIDRQFALADDKDPEFRETALRAYYEKQIAAGRAKKYSGDTVRTGDGTMIETAEEFTAPDGSLLGVCLTRKSQKDDRFGKRKHKFGFGKQR